jgi:hypothetical protein
MIGSKAPNHPAFQQCQSPKQVSAALRAPAIDARFELTYKGDFIEGMLHLTDVQIP